MKQLLLILSITLLTIGSGICQNRYSKDKVTHDYDSGITNDSTGTPVNGIVFSEFENGQIRFEGNYKDGKEEGLQRQWYENGQLELEGSFKGGKGDGLHKWWWKNGQITTEGNYKDGKADALWRDWYENGQLRRVYRYKDGNLISEKKWDEDANLIKDKTY